MQVFHSLQNIKNMKIPTIIKNVDEIIKLVLILSEWMYKMEKGLDLIKTVMNRVKTRYEKILEDYYPSYESLGFTERNLTFNFCSQYEQLWNEKSSHEHNLVIWQEVPICNEGKLGEHIDSLIIDNDCVYLIEAKRLNGTDKIASIKSDIKRLKNVAIGKLEINKIPQNVKMFLIVLVDFWLPRLSANQKNKNKLRESFNELCSKNAFSIVYDAEVCTSKGISDAEHYYLLCSACEV
ncbi:hypothetical protein SAMN05720467_1085 [Fibrobacter sp. UWB7]|nr:hypothetical protein SAMN05720467_1085 [Fibrobacter sp. UWB7]